MSIDLSTINLSLVGWALIAVAVLVLVFGILHFFGHLLHILLRGCGLILLAAVILYALHLLKMI